MAQHKRWGADVRLWRTSFAIALIAALFLALKPAGVDESAFVYSDKAKHALAFAVLWVLGIWAGLRPWPLALGLLAFGGTIELLQSVTPTREASWGDWLADATGIALGRAFSGRWSPVRPAAGLR